METTKETRRTTDTANQVHAAYATSDLQLAAVLISLGYRLLRVEAETGDRRTKVFVLQNIPQQIVLDFYTGEDDFHARALFGAYHNLKRLALRS